MSQQAKVLYEHTHTYRKGTIHTFTTYVWESGTLVRIISESTDSAGGDHYREQTHSFGHWLNSITPEEFVADKGIEARFI